MFDWLPIVVAFVLGQSLPGSEVSEGEIDDPADYTPGLVLVFAKRCLERFLVDTAALEIPVSLVVYNHQIAEQQVLVDCTVPKLKLDVFVQILVVQSSHSMHRILVVLVGTVGYTWRMPVSPIADWTLH